MILSTKSFSQNSQNYFLSKSPSGVTAICYDTTRAAVILEGTKALVQSHKLLKLNEEALDLCKESSAKKEEAYLGADKAAKSCVSKLEVCNKQNSMTRKILIFASGFVLGVLTVGYLN